MKESVTYQAIAEEGRVAALQELILDLGREKFGAPGTTVEMAVRSITDLERLRRLSKLLLRAASWRDLLAMP